MPHDPEPIRDLPDLLLFVKERWQPELGYERDSSAAVKRAAAGTQRSAIAQDAAIDHHVAFKLEARLMLSAFGSVAKRAAVLRVSDSPAPGDFLGGDPVVSTSENEPPGPMRVDWVSMPSLDLEAIKPGTCGPDGPTGVARVDRLLATLFALRELVRDARDFEECTEESGLLVRSDLDRQLIERLTRLLGTKSKDWDLLPERVWLFERPDAGHDSLKDGSRPLTLWGRAAFVHLRLVARCEALLARVEPQLSLPLTQQLATRLAPPCMWDDGEIRQLDSARKELRAAAEQIGKALCAREPASVLERLTAAQRELYELLTTEWQTAEQIRIALKSRFRKMVELNTVQKGLNGLKAIDLVESRAGRSGGYRRATSQG